MRTKEITAANRAAWDEAAPIHAKHNQAKLIERFGDPAFTLLDDVATTRLDAIGVAGKDAAQVCCNNGRELICVQRMGAARCVGFDGSAGFVEQARELNAAAGTDCEFVCTDIHDIGPAYDASFDLVTVTVGVFGWMPDLAAFYQAIEKLMRPDAALFIHEQHPALDMMSLGGPDAAVEFEYSYFNKDGIVETDGLDYWSGEAYDAKPVMWFSHTLAEIVMGGVGAGLAVEHVEEFPEHICNTWYNVEKQVDGFPMSYALVFRKPG